MAYRDAPLVLPKAPPSLVLPARIVGIAALAFVVVHLGNVFLVSDELRLRWYQSHSAMPRLVFWVAFACRLAIVPGGVLYGLRTDDRRARVLAFAAAALLTVGLLSNVWAVVSPVVYEADSTRPYWAPPKYVIPAREHVATLAFAAGQACLAWAMARRDARTLATVVTVFAFGNAFYQVVYALEVPWIQLMSGDKNAARIASRATSFAFQGAAFALGLAGIAHPRPGPPRPADAPPTADRAPEAAAAYDGVAPLVAGILAATLPLAIVCSANALMTLGRAPRDFGNWMSASGVVRLEYFETMTYVPYGALACAAVFCVYASLRAREGATSSFMGIGALGLAIMTVSIFMRGRWKVPISPSYDFTHFQAVMAACAAAVFLGAAQLARTLRSKCCVLATEEDDDIHSPLFRMVDAAPFRALVAALLAGFGFLMTAFGDVTTSTSTHEALAVVGGLASAAAVVFAIAAAVSQARGRYALAEAVRRRAGAPDADADPTSLM